MGPFFFSFGLANRFRFSFQLELGPVIRDPGSSAEISQVPSRISQQQSVIEPVAPQTLCNRQDGIPRKANSEQGLDTASSNLENGSHTPLDQAKTTNKKDTVAARIPSPDAIGSSTGPGARGRLSLIPQEVRNIIYRLLLVSTTVIENPANMFDDEQPLMLHERRKIEDIDPVICRTSRLIYKETQPILYGENSYLFDDGFKLWQFGKSVTSKPLTSFVTHTSIREARSAALRRFIPLGVTRGLRRVTFKFRLDSSPPFYPHYDYQPGRDASWRNWKEYFFVSKHSFDQPIELKALEVLVLDFSEWRLKDTEGLSVTVLVSKLKKSPKLKDVSIKGLRHERTLRALREGLVKDGGRFTVL